MNTIANAVIPADVLADLEYAARLQITGQRDLGFEKRIRAEAEKIRQEILAKHGILNVAVDFVREGRDGE